MVEMPFNWTHESLDKCLADVLDYRGQSVPKSNSGVPLITARNVREGSLDMSRTEYIPEDLYEAWMDRGLPKTGDILFTTEAPLGMVAPFPETGRYALGQRLVALRVDDRRLHSGFLLQFLLSEVGKRRVVSLATGSTAQGIRQSELRKLEIPVPPLPEQRKIAQILGMWDAAIGRVEQLIAALQRRKQGLMQRLLTGEVRFGEYDEPWSERTLQDLVTVTYGKSPSGIQADPGKYAIYGTGGIVGQTNTCLCDQSAVIIGRKGTIDKPILVEQPFWAIDTTFYCLTNANVDIGWFYYAISNVDLRSYNEASGVPSLSRNTLYSIRLHVPELPEQQRIAQVLRLCDEELALHRQKLAALRRQKQGLMQRLLTGAVRVKVDGQNAGG